MRMPKWMSALVLVLVVTMPKAEAMTMNLAMKWDDGCSGPQTPFLSFYSPQRESTLRLGAEHVSPMNFKVPPSGAGEATGAVSE